MVRDGTTVGREPLFVALFKGSTTLRPFGLVGGGPLAFW